MWERARAGHATRVVRDQTGRPTYTRDLAAAVWTLIGRNVCGVVHLANQGEATWLDVAARVFARAGRANTRAATSSQVASDRKSTRLNSSHRCISYAVFCLKKKNSRTISAQPG